MDNLEDELRHDAEAEEKAVLSIDLEALILLVLAFVMLAIGGYLIL